MLDFSGLDNTSGAFPSVVATNSSGPTLRDGTPITANLVNDIWGAFQAILNAAGTTPSDSVETSSASDLLDSIRKLGGAPGEVVMYATPSDVIDANILPLKGQVITIASYPALVAATYIGDTANANANTDAFCKFSDALGTVKSTSGLYFKLADCRGYFLRALAGSATTRDFGRQYLTQQFTFDFHNLSGTVIDESPGIHTHDVIDVSGTQQLLTQPIYAFTSDPGVPLGGATATTMTVYKRGTGTTELLAKIGKYGPDDYGSSDFYAEVRPAHTAFQLGIRY
jgi:hypothetical protein